MSDLLNTNTAVVTGGASGIGRAIATAFAEHGADVVVADVRETPRLGGDPTHEVINANTAASAEFVHCDVTSRSDIETAVATAESFGTVDVMVNNAGVERFYDFLDPEEDAYDDVMDINTRSTYLGAQTAALEMLQNDGGSIINVASIRSDIGRGDYVSYCVAKGAVQTMTYALADALGPEIRVNALKPGTIETAMTTVDGDMGEYAIARRCKDIPLDRLGQPGDVAKVAVFLASDLASYVTGESILVDGGLTNTSSL